MKALKITPHLCIPQASASANAIHMAGSQAQGEHPVSSSQAVIASYMFLPRFPHGKSQELWRSLC